MVPTQQMQLRIYIVNVPPASPGFGKPSAPFLNLAAPIHGGYRSKPKESTTLNLIIPAPYYGCRYINLLIKANGNSSSIILC